MSNASVKALLCPYCGTAAELVDSAVIYHGRSYGPAWRCPACPDAYVGCHRGTTRPLGRLANRELRASKVKAHEAFDRLWRGGLMSRSEAYKLLADWMGLDREDCHIGEFDVDQCQAVVELCGQMSGNG